MTAFERRDYAAAAREFSALAAAGDNHAQYMLGRLHAEGNGVSKNPVQAYKWHQLAAARGHGHAAEARDLLARNMTQAQVSKAQTLAREWRSDAADSYVETPPLTYRQLSSAVQSTLNELGYDAGPADGAMGGTTRAAIRDYQKDHGLAIDGQPSAALLQHLTASLRTARGDSGRTGVAADNRQCQSLLLHDSFSDGDYTRDPAWTVAAGRFGVEQGIGLRSTHEPRQPAAQTRTEDLPMAILAAILGEATRPGSSGDASETPDYSEIHVNRTLSNAFAIQLVLTLRQSTGPLSFGPYQDADQISGYRLVYTPDIANGLHLVRLTAAGGSSVIASVDPRFSLNRQYSLKWTRDNRDGAMVVSVDGSEILRAVDRGFNDPFYGFTLLNRGGDYAMREITIHGSD